ncbi:putative organic anion transporter [Ixodes scapularis]
MVRHLCSYVLFVLCCMVFLQGLVANGLVYMVLPTIERRFQFRSLETGTIVSMYHLASCISAPVMTLVAAKRSKPLYLSLAAVVIAIGTLILTLPHFLVPQYRQSTYEVDLCPHKGDDPAVCSTPTGNLRSYRFVFWAGHLIVGAGSSPMYTLALTYLDENLPTTLSIKYIATYQATSLFGTASGFVLSGYLLNIYTELTVEASRLGLTSDSNVWIGAWWLGYLVGSIFSLVVAFPTSLLPKELPSMIMTGMATFMTKFFEAQLGMSSPNIAHILGCVAMPSACGGILLGGYCVYKLNLGIDGILRMCLLCSIVPWFTSFILLYSCPNPKFFGLNHTSSRFFVSTVTNQFEQDCNAYCFCPVEFYNPVCGKDNATYYSPCFAGCKRDYVYDSLKRPYATRRDQAGPMDRGTSSAAWRCNQSQQTTFSRSLCPAWSRRVSFIVPQAYTDCSCIMHEGESFEVGMGAPVTVQADRKKCALECNALGLYLTGISLYMFFTFLLYTPGVSATISVSREPRRYRMRRLLHRRKAGAPDEVYPRAI